MSLSFLKKRGKNTSNSCASLEFFMSSHQMLIFFHVNPLYKYFYPDIKREPKIFEKGSFLYLEKNHNVREGLRTGYFIQTIRHISI